MAPTRGSPLSASVILPLMFWAFVYVPEINKMLVSITDMYFIKCDVFI